MADLYSKGKLESDEWELSIVRPITYYIFLQHYDYHVYTISREIVPLFRVIEVFKDLLSLKHI